MKTLSVYISYLFFSLLLSFSTLAQKSEIKVSYEKKPLKALAQNTDSQEAYFVDLVKEITWTASKRQLWKATRKNNSIKEWELTEGKEKGEVTFVKNRENETFEWYYMQNGQEVKIVIIDLDENYYRLNDPREITIIHKGKKYILNNQEPDCNSSFALYDSNTYNNDNPTDKYLLYLSAKNACQATNWIIKVKEKETPKIVQQAAAFVAVMAQTCRYFSDLKSEGIID